VAQHLWPLVRVVVCGLPVLAYSSQLCLARNMRNPRKLFSSAVGLLGADDFPSCQADAWRQLNKGRPDRAR